MKLYPNLVKAITDSLSEIFNSGELADVVVANTLKKDSRWGSRDRKFIASNIYNCVRWFRLYKSCITDEQWNRHSYYAIFAVAQILNGVDLPSWPEFEDMDSNQVKLRYDDAIKTRKLKASIPDWLDTMGESLLGTENWTIEIDALNKEADVFLRVNTLKNKLSSLQETLIKEQIETETVQDPLFENSTPPLRIIKRQALNNLQSYKNGLFEIQDAASQLIAPFLRVEPGMYVIDACAGAGGKTLHLACLMQNKGNILALDISERKLDELKKRALRAGIGLIKTNTVSDDIIHKNRAQADRLLLDVPCSGSGVIKRNPDAKWKLNENFMEEIQRTQSGIINKYSTMLKPGGLMVYATCSILPIENEIQVRNFLNKQNGSFELLTEQHVMPSQGYDGFYMALIKKS